jgi:hypothetical protein
MTTETSSPFVAALSAQIHTQASGIVSKLIGETRAAVNTLAGPAGLEWYRDTILRAAVSTTDANEHRAKLEALVTERLSQAAAARILAPPPPAEPINVPVKRKQT